MDYDDIRFAERGSNVKIYPYVSFVKPENIHLKNNIIVSQFCYIEGGNKTLIGNYIHLANYLSIVGGGTCILEDFVSPSAGVRIITGSELVKGEGFTNPTLPHKYRATKRSFVHIEKHVFLATNVIILPGVTIGEGAVIGANSVVTKDIEPWTINVGSPAKPISKRPSEKIKSLEAKVYNEYNIIPTSIEEYLPLKITTNSIPQE